MVEQLLANEPKERAAAFALAAYPAAVAGRLPIGAEGVNDLGRFAQPLLTVDAEISWQERLSDAKTTHPELAAYAPVLARLNAARRERAQQLFYFCIVNNITVANAARVRAGVPSLRAGVRRREDRMTLDTSSQTSGYRLVSWDEDGIRAPGQLRRPV